jgi:soluble lytic murein transglycosylase
MNKPLPNRLCTLFRRGSVAATLLLLLAGLPSAPALAASEAATRKLYEQTREQLRRGEISRAEAGIRQLRKRDYPLTPYLELTLLTRRIDALSKADIDAFLARYPDSVPGDRLRVQWLAALARQQRWGEYLREFEQAYADPTQAALVQRCWQVQALHATGRGDEAFATTQALWLTPTSVPDACDKPFALWQQSGGRSDALVWQRLLLTLERGDQGLSRYLAGELKREPLRSQGQRALQLLRDPTAIKRLWPEIARASHASPLLAYGARRLVRSDVDGAEQLWIKLNQQKLLKPEDSARVRSEIGRYRIASRGVDALPWLLEHDPNGEDSALLEWRIRLALRKGDWQQAERWLALLPSELAETSRWRYWKARALAQNSEPEKLDSARQLFEQLAAERSFYGFLAAERLQRPYQFNDRPLHPDTSPTKVAQRPDIRRAREFHQLGEVWSAHSEWTRALRSMTQPEQQAAAQLAVQWGWYNLAIRTATNSGGWDDLSARFPLAYRPQLERAAQRTELPLEWIYAITRQESAFMPAVKSSAGAIGLMQLLPGTASQVARSLRVPHSNDKLVDPSHNTMLGSEYLRQLHQRYDGNRILATAAYNAGPGRISRWLREQPEQVGADVWIETIPYRETREYVQSVMSFALIYSYRLGREDGRLLLAHEWLIGDDSLRVAQSEQP